MKPLNFQVILLALLFTLSIFPYTFSATSVTIISPNGSEYFSGTENITWDFNDTSVSQNVDFNLWLGTSNQPKIYFLSSNLSFTSSCNTSSSTFFSTASTNYNSGLISRGTSWTSQYVFNGVNYMGWLPSTNSVKLYKWISNSWVDVSPTIYDNNIGAGACGQSVLGEIGGNLYLFVPTYYKRVGRAGDYFAVDMNAYLINLSTGHISYDSEKTYETSEGGSSGTGFSYTLRCTKSGTLPLPNIDFFVYDGIPYMTSVYSATKNAFEVNTAGGYSWNGFGWVANSSFNFPSDSRYSAIYNNGDTPNLITMEYTDSNIHAYDISLAGFTSNFSLVKGLTYDANNFSFGKLNSNDVYFGSSIKDLKQSYETNKSSNCSKSFNTFNYPNFSNYKITIDAKGSTSTSDISNATFSISNYSSSSLPITPINNISGVSYDSNAITLNILNNSANTIWSILNNTGSSVDVSFLISNNDTSGSQYFVYTSTNGSDWVFSDTLTFGATTSTPIQKIWDANLGTYVYSFSDNLTSQQTKYYKLVFQDVAKYWSVINSSSDWFNQNSPTNWNDSTGKAIDVFSDSNYSNVQSYTILPYQNLVSTDFDVGYELQFTAYGTSAGTLAVGSRASGVDTTSNISVTTTAKRFSVPIAPSTRDAQLLIKSTSATSNTYYIRDYAIVPRSYFVNQLEIQNTDGTELQAILRNGSSLQYIKEGQPVKVKTSAYDVSGDLDKLEVQTFIGSVMVKDQFFDLTSFAGNYVTFNQTIDGVIDLNGIGGELTTTSSLKTITYKAILWNTSNQSVSEQYKTVSILQFPYFPNDFKMTSDILNTKVGENPRLRISIKDSVPSNFLGIAFAFFDGSHTITAPNYSETIYAGDLKCTDLTSCTKELTFDEYVWEGAGAYTIQVTALINTEVKNYTNSFTNVRKVAYITASGYQLVQLIQYMERHQNAFPHTPYQPTERVPLMLGVVDDGGKDLSNTLAPYFSIIVGDQNYTTKFYPDAFRYDETTGTNIWLWNQYLYDDAGSLLSDGNSVQFNGVLADKRQTQTSGSTFGFANRCTTYPADVVGTGASYVADWWNGLVGSDIFGWKLNKDSNGWIAQFVNLYGSITGSVGLNGCIAYPENVVSFGSISDANITIDSTFDLTAHADNRQALYCGQKYDNNVIIDQMGDEFGCVLLIHEDLQQIDGVRIQMGNENSDYSIVNQNKQYLDFSITSNDIMFSDTSALLRGWFQKGYFGASPTNSPTIEDFVFSAWHDYWTPNLTNEQIKEQYKFTEMIGGNELYSFESDFNNSVYNKAIIFKVSGLSTINIYDYLTAEQRDSFNTKNFLSYASTNNLPIYPKKMRITIYNNAGEEALQVIETTSPLIINKAPSTKQQVMGADGNISIVTTSEILPIHVISTMSSANSTISNRLIAELKFRQIIRANPVNTDSGTNIGGLIGGAIEWGSNVLFGKDSQNNPNGIVNNPIGFISNPFNITILFLILGLVLVFTLMARNVSVFFDKNR